jgi:hypothetical protein
MGGKACDMYRYINNCSYKNTSVHGPEYIMNDHEEEGNTIFTCSALDTTMPSWLDCLQPLGRLSK